MRYIQGITLFVLLIFLLIVFTVIMVSGVIYFVEQGLSPENIMSENSNNMPAFRQNYIQPADYNNSPQVQAPSPSDNTILQTELQSNSRSINRVVTFIESGDWDEYFREIGNVILAGDTYYFYYSGHQGVNYKGKSDIYVGVATSKDGKNFIKQGRTMDLPAEDPYVIVKDNVFYMFYEDKREVPDIRTSLATSSDGIHFSLAETGVLNPTKGIQASSASSPAAIVVDGDIKILYEIIGFFPDGRRNEGQIALYEHGIQPDNPVFIGSNDPSKYDEFVATDDVIKIGDKFYLSYHALQSNVKWTAAVAWSTDLKNWHRSEAPQFDYYFNDMTVMFLKQGDCFNFLITDENKKSIGIYSNPKLKEIGFPACDNQQPDTQSQEQTNQKESEAVADTDRDGLSDQSEQIYGTNSNNPDTDGDGYIDGDEVKNGYNPNGPGKLNSIPY